MFTGLKYINMPYPNIFTSQTALPPKMEVAITAVSEFGPVSPVTALSLSHKMSVIFPLALPPLNADILGIQ